MKMENEYEIDNLDIREYQNNNANANVNVQKKKKPPKEMHSD